MLLENKYSEIKIEINKIKIQTVGVLKSSFEII